VTETGVNLEGRFGFPGATLAFGGELPLGCDALLAEPRPLPDSCLAFSHGRAALRWLCEHRGRFDCAVLSAYTCPSVPDFLENLGLRLKLVDVFSADWEQAVGSERGRLLVVLPAFLGHEPEADISRLAAAVGERGVVVVDAAQTAFGHLCFETAENVVVISGPRKCAGLGDGAILRMHRLSEEESALVQRLPWAIEPVAAKLAARSLMACRSPENEADALALTARAERTWPDTPHRMSGAGLWRLSWLDPQVHADARWRNWNALSAALEGEAEILRLSGGTPFNLSILVEDRAALLARLHAARVFATPLWPDARRESDLHPRAEDLARRLIGLPIDQRYEETDMLELAGRVRQCMRQ
jgi:hypothetical protein